MNVKVLFFGATAEAAGKREIGFEAQTGKNAAEVFDEILAAFPGLQKSFGKTLLFSINQEYANGDESVSDGDELAVFTAVSGG